MLDNSPLVKVQLQNHVQFCGGHLDPRMAWVLTMWSSRSCCVSSTDARILVPDVRYSFVSKMRPPHSSSMVFMLFSREYSLDAATQV